MPYSAEISRGNPSLFLFMLDQSGSMEDPFGSGESKRKADELADAMNRLLFELSLKCAKDEGVRDYYEVGLLGYTNNQVVSAFAGTLAGREIVPSAS